MPFLVNRSSCPVATSCSRCQSQASASKEASQSCRARSCDPRRGRDVATRGGVIRGSGPLKCLIQRALYTRH